jgi:hypothetical protein
MLDSWANPGSDLNRFPKKTSKLSALLVNQKETLRIECTTQSHLRYIYGVLQYLSVCSLGRDGDRVLILFLMHSH